MVNQSNTDFTYNNYFLIFNFSSDMIFLLGYNKIDQKQKFNAFTWLNYGANRRGHFHA